MVKKVAICGCVPHWEKAPFDDETFEVWFQYNDRMPRWNRMFELHPHDKVRHATHRPLWLWMAAQDGSRPIYMKEPHPDIKGSVRFPREKLVAEFGTWFFTGTAHWELAMAIQEGYEVIGLYGIDYGSDDERRKQRDGIRHFIQIARDRGIEVVAPAESLILNPGYLYAMDDNEWLLSGVEHQMADVDRVRAEIMQQQKLLDLQMMNANGARKTLQHALDNWFDRGAAIAKVEEA